jgi:hypothetical protein
MRALFLSLITLVALSSAGTVEALTVTEKCLMKTHLIVGAFKKCLANQSAKVAKGKAENTDQGDAKCAARFEKTWNKNRDKSLQDDPGAAACNAATTDAVRQMQEAAALVAAGRSLDPYAELNLSDLEGSGIAAEADLDESEVDLDECEGDLGTTTGSLNTCTADLGSANTALATCELDLAICNAPPTPACIAGTEEGFEDVGDLLTAGWSSPDFNAWEQNSGHTISSGTGPSQASEGFRYLYTEASSPRQEGDIFLMESPAFTGGSIVKFDLSRVGAGIGSLDVSVNEFLGGGVCDVPCSIGTFVGPGNEPGPTSEWSTEYLDLPAGLGEYALWFTYTRGSSHLGDLAIDAFCIME